jgi:hypothetical protein
MYNSGKFIYVRNAELKHATREENEVVSTNKRKLCFFDTKVM